MTPAARVAAAIEILDEILAGSAAEKTLTNWARGRRFAGSGDRHAIRDLVFDGLRRKRSYAWLGGADTGRGLMLGALLARSEDLETYFTGLRHAPSKITVDEASQRDLGEAPRAVQLDLPDWLLPQIEDSLGDDFVAIAEALQERAPVYLRANLLKTNREAAAQMLREGGVETTPSDGVDTAIKVTANPRRIRQSRAYLDGFVELQDLSSQAVVDALPISGRVLDYCAGGGGKALAMAARGATEIVAHDRNFARMSNLHARAQRAGASIRTVRTSDLEREGKFDLVLCDVPCSGSGAWRRSPEGKWQLTAERLVDLTSVQFEILNTAARLVGDTGHLTYSTCSLLKSENEAVVERFLSRSPDWKVLNSGRFDPVVAGDGFFFCVFKRLSH